MRHFSLLLFLLLAGCSGGHRELVPEDKPVLSVPVVKVESERLPRLNIPRNNNHLLYTSTGEIMALGGHTTGFVLTQTAEIFDGKTWTVVPMNYPHDGGFCVPLSDGSLLVGGGSGESFGIGQSWGVERFLPEQGRFDPVDILDRPRAYTSALVMPGDTVYVSGNWYAPDDLESFVDGSRFAHVKTVAEQRRLPYMLPSAPGQAIIFSGQDHRGNPSDGWVDRLHGEPFQVPLLQEWHPRWLLSLVRPEQAAIGKYTYLIPAERLSDGQIGIIMVSGEGFSLLETDLPIPTATPDGDPIQWHNQMQVYRPGRKAYMAGRTVGGRHLLLLEVDYDAALDGGAGKLKIYYSDVADDRVNSPAMLITTEGNILLSGGFIDDQFHPVDDVILLRISPSEAASGATWPWVLAAALLSAGVVFLVLRRRRKLAASAPETGAVAPDLMSRIVALMDTEQLYLNPDLRLADLATKLGTNTTYVSACINGQAGQSFSDFIAGYRIRYACDLLRKHPDMRLSEVAEQSGFTGERSFFRSFKAITGQTPSEWKKK